ncbi:MAG: phosphoglucosamine mutase [Lentisphaeria bacterium]|nr:phosphoglucosamine mutase [Lentisphaeria bacterium]
MGTFFGTDGIRGRANRYPITADVAFRIGQALGQMHLRKNQSGSIVIGRDTRSSGDMLEAGLIAGLLAQGMDVYRTGVLPTPAVAHITRTTQADFGVMITASHNPSCDNGIKIFGNDGYKLPDRLEERVESYIMNPSRKDLPERPGRVIPLQAPQGRYIDYIKRSSQGLKLNGMKIVLDCANGAAYDVAPWIFQELGADLIVIGDRPTGQNINNNCGATAPEQLAKTVKDNNADIGLAFDGDADRLVVVDECGDVVSGDALLGLCAAKLKEHGELRGNTAVVTVMSNLGLHKYLESKGISTIVTNVGDRNVIKEMLENDFNFGGEESGHIIFSDYASTGDGIGSAIQLLHILSQSDQPISKLSKEIELFPSKLTNLNIGHKLPLEEIRPLQKLNNQFAKEHGDSARYLIRYSGTENKVRILVEAETQEDVDKWSGLYESCLIEALKDEV